MHPKAISISDYTYDLPADKIALHPVHPRDRSKLLIYNKKQISEDIYSRLPNHLPENATLVFNDTRVIHSRLLFPKKTGAVIEIFCLEPSGEFTDHEHFFARRGSARWKCMIGKAGKWKEKYLTRTFRREGQEIRLRAELIDRLPDAYVVELTWTPENITHGEIINAAGVVPLPPYIKRKADRSDESDYQTVYSEHDGSVAAPTAGLHFTQELMQNLRKEDIPTLFTTLHVGAGTFKPVTSDTMEGHVMHDEWMVLTPRFLEQLLEQEGRCVICVGTTACRTLESIYRMGNKIINHPETKVTDLRISQWEAYEPAPVHEPTAAVSALLNRINDLGLDHLLIETGIIIAPGYTFGLVDGLITNFHMPQSTLLLLVAALVGEDWRKIYEYALGHDFRFLSYGDGSLLLP